MGAVPLIAGAAAVGGGLFGKNKGQNPGGSTNQSQSVSGFEALPGEVKNAYLKQYLPDILQQYQGKISATPLGQAETGPFASLGLQQLQNYSNQNGGIFNGTTGVNPLGAIEPFNEYQKSALASLGGGLEGLQQQLPGYMNPYSDIVGNEINRQAQIGQSNLKNQFTQQAGLGGLSSSAFGTALSGNEEARQRLQNENQYNNYNQALNLRRQTLGEMLQAGGAIQQQGQASLDYLSPYLQGTTPQARSGMLAQQLGMIPGSQVSNSTGNQWGANAGRPDFMSRLGGAGLTTLGIGQGLGLSGFGGR